MYYLVATRKIDFLKGSNAKTRHNIKDIQYLVACNTGVGHTKQELAEFGLWFVITKLNDHKHILKIEIFFFKNSFTEKKTY